MVRRGRTGVARAALGAACAVVAVAMTAATAEARIATYEVSKDDRSLILLREPFGFAVGGDDGDRAERTARVPARTRAAAG